MLVARGEAGGASWLLVMWRGFAWSAPVALAFLLLLSLAFSPISGSESALPSSHDFAGSGLRRLKGASGVHKRLRWTFAWAAGVDGSCKCNEVSWGEYRTEDECLRDFAAHPQHSCTYHGFGVVEADCKFAVSVDPSIKNSDCVAQCEASVDAEGFAMLDELFRLRCSVEKYDVARGGVYSSSKCFTNEVHGHSDTSLELGIPDVQVYTEKFLNVPTASACQELCQEDTECHTWLWRSSFDAGGLPPHTCLFKSTEMVQMATAATIPVGPFGRDEPYEYNHPAWQYCDLQNKYEEIKNAYSQDTEECNCGCVWRSPQHLSGPKYCEAVIDGSKDHWGAGPPSQIIGMPSSEIIVN